MHILTESNGLKFITIAFYVAVKQPIQRTIEMFGTHWCGENYILIE